MTRIAGLLTATFPLIVFLTILAVIYFDVRA